MLNVSLGVTSGDNIESMAEMLRNIFNDGTIIVAAFDNMGSISYPAALQFVIGVDTTKTLIKPKEYQFVENSIVNIRVANSLMRVAWIDPLYVMVKGTSFSCAYITACVTNLLLQNRRLDFKQVLMMLRENAASVADIPPNRFSIENACGFPMHIGHAAIFPFNKEMHALIRFPDLVDASIDGVFDIRLSGRVGLSIKDAMRDVTIQSDAIIQDIDHIEWAKYDTLIIGHLDDLMVLSKDMNMRENLLKAALANSLQVYSFDSLSQHNDDLLCYVPNEKVFWPRISKNMIPRNRFGKLHIISKPIICVCGTKARQGKYTVQLMLRRLFQEEGYGVGQLGTEPNGYLFAMDALYPSGYNGDVELSNLEIILAVNEMLHNMDVKESTDIILTGTQSGMIAIDNSNTDFYPLHQQWLLQAIQPDAIILCTSFEDDPAILRRTIQAIEGLSQGVVIGIVLFPLELHEGWMGYSGKRIPIDDERILLKLDEIHLLTNKPCFALNKHEDIKNLYAQCIEFFSAERA